MQCFISFHYLLLLLLDLILLIFKRPLKSFLMLTNTLYYTQFFNKQLLDKQQGFKKLKIKQSEGFKM